MDDKNRSDGLNKTDGINIMNVTNTNARKCWCKVCALNKTRSRQIKMYRPLEKKKRNKNIILCWETNNVYYSRKKKNRVFPMCARETLCPECPSTSASAASIAGLKSPRSSLRMLRPGTGVPITSEAEIEICYFIFVTTTRFLWLLETVYNYSYLCFRSLCRRANFCPRSIIFKWRRLYCT